MPTLHRIGKEKVVNHHLDVPYKVLDHKYWYTDGKKNKNQASWSSNMIIQWDNLEALKSLLPKYESKVKCIYIDPPYNTGNEWRVYNDNVNHPKIKKRLWDVVGKEWEDLSRHDKWLCMMYPRLKLLHRLLRNDGVIFVSIDDAEYANMKQVLDEIFWLDKFVATNVWQKRYSRENREAIWDVHEYIIVYSKNPKSFKQYRKLLPPTKAQEKVYRNPNNDPNWRRRPIPLTAQEWNATASQFYEITAPWWKVFTPPNWRCWAVAETTYYDLLSKWRIYFWKNNNSQPNMIRYFSEVKWVAPWTWRNYEEVWHTDEAKKEVHALFWKKNAFDTPKPTRLLNRIFEMATSGDDIILDSFAWTWTTAHAVLNLNKQDGGNRKFILVEMEDYAESITAERVNRVIDGYGEEKKAVEGTWWSYDYYTLWEPMFVDEDTINEAIWIEKIREYIRYTETKSDTPVAKKWYILWIQHQTEYHFYYDADSITTLDHTYLTTLSPNDWVEQRVVYADLCALDDVFLRKHNIIFKKIPRDISRF